MLIGRGTFFMTSDTNSIFGNLPGLEVPVSEISDVLSHVWEVSTSKDAVNPSEFRATQMNLIIHLGLGTTPSDARDLFETALRFARRKTSRILRLCHVDRYDS